MLWATFRLHFYRLNPHKVGGAWVLHWLLIVTKIISVNWFIQTITDCYRCLSPFWVTKRWWCSDAIPYRSSSSSSVQRCSLLDSFSLLCLALNVSPFPTPYIMLYFILNSCSELRMRSDLHYSIKKRISRSSLEKLTFFLQFPYQCGFFSLKFGLYCTRICDDTRYVINIVPRERCYQFANFRIELFWVHYSLKKTNLAMRIYIT